jgi:hypothetical protein
MQSLDFCIYPWGSFAEADAPLRRALTATPDQA